VKAFSPTGMMVKGFFGAVYAPFLFGAAQTFGNPDGAASGGGAWAAGGASPYGPNQGGNPNPPIANAVYAVAGGLSHLDTSEPGGSVSNPQITIAGGRAVVSQWAVTQFPPLPGAPVQTLLFLIVEASDGQTITQADLVAFKFAWPYTHAPVNLTGAGATSFSFAAPNAEWQYDLTGLFAMTDTANHDVALGLTTI
jgi:hypothetical protein